MIFTRVFSPDIYGQYTIVMNTAIIVSALLTQWIILSIQRFKPIYKKEGKVAEFNEHLLSLMFYITVGFLIISFLLYILLPQNLIKYQEYYLPAVLMIVGSNYFAVLGGVYQIDLLTREYRNYNIWMSGLKLLFTLICLYVFQRDPVAFIWAALIAQVLVIIPMGKRLHLGNLITLGKYRKDMMPFFIPSLVMVFL